MVKELQIPLKSEDLYVALLKAGVLPEGAYCRWFSIMAETGNLVKISIELEGDQRLLCIVPELAEGKTPNVA